MLSRVALRQLRPSVVGARTSGHTCAPQAQHAAFRFASSKSDNGPSEQKQEAATAQKGQQAKQQEPKQQQAKQDANTEQQQQQQQQQDKTEHAGRAKAGSRDGGEVRGPIRKLIDLFHHVKSQVTEDNVHYDRSKPYVAPADRRRSSIERPAKKVEENADEKGMIMHKESRWETQWKNFKDSNPVVSGFFGLQERFDESDNILVRGARSFTDTISERFRGMFDDDESAAVLAEIRRIDPTFDRLNFSLHLEKNVIPAVLEAFVAGDLEPLKEWCAEPCYKSLETLIEQRKQAGVYLESRILDISNVEFLTAKRMDEGMVLLFSFQAQQTKCVRDRTGKVMEGGEDNIEQSIYVFAMRRDPNIFDPLLAWQVLEIGEQHSQPII